MKLTVMGKDGKPLFTENDQGETTIVNEEFKRQVEEARKDSEEEK